jgi:hypothetical protein
MFHIGIFLKLEGCEGELSYMQAVFYLSKVACWHCNTTMQIVTLFYIYISGCLSSVFTVHYSNSPNKYTCCVLNAVELLPSVGLDAKYGSGCKWLHVMVKFGRLHHVEVCA